MPPKTQVWHLKIWPTPLGPLLLTFTPMGLARLEFTEGGHHPSAVPGLQTIPDLDFPPPDIASRMSEAIRTLADYFAGLPTDFASLPLDLQGTTFQLKVWEKLQKIPWGTTISYQELANRLGKPKAARAVGQANGANPLPIIIPCHRVIAADGSLGGYSSGLDRKRWLLRHESLGGGPGLETVFGFR